MTSIVSGPAGNQATVNFNGGYLHTINGELVGLNRTFPVINPATKKVVAVVPHATDAQLEQAVAGARSAFPAWSATPIAERQRLVVAIGDVLEQFAEEFTTLLTREQGKQRAGAEFEIFGSIAWCREMATLALAEETVEESDLRSVVVRQLISGSTTSGWPG
jgi:acyl-CoA reductase-like NAD-dependent aldehyde dehydrogenase